MRETSGFLGRLGARRRPSGQRGFTWIEMLVTLTVVSILATTAIPLARWDDKRRREARLQRSLQMMRGAIDQFNKYMAEGVIVPEDVEQCGLAADPRTCYPLTLEQLVEGVDLGDPESPEFKSVKFLQRIPVDPFSELPEWGLRSYQDDYDSDSWGGENVYDVYCLTEIKALDGSYYNEW